MTFWTYLFVNTVLSLAAAALLIWTKPENRAKRAEAKMRREEDLLNMMLEAAKRIDEERKPSQEFTPPPEKKPPAPQTNLCDSCHYRNQLCHKTGIRKCSNYIKEEPPKPPTTVSEASKQKCGISADEAAKLFSKLAEASACFGGISEFDELQERLKDIADRLDRAEKKPVTPERLKEAGFEVAPVHSCGSCYWFSEGGGGKFGLCIRNDEIADRDGQKACFDPQERRSKVRPKPLGAVTTR